MGVPLGLGQGEKFLHRQGPASRLDEPGGKPLLHTGVREEGPLRLGQRADTGQEGTLQVGQGGGLQLLRPGGGQETVCQVPPAGGDPLPEDGGGGEALRRARGVVARSLAGDRQYLGGPAQGGGGPQVLHPQVVIGTGEDLRPLRSQQGRHHSLAAGGEGHPFVQKAAQARPVCLAVQAGGRRGQGGRVPALAAEGEDVHHAAGPEQGDGARSKGLGGGGRPHCGQLQHQVRPPGQGPARPGPLVRCGAGAPLDPVAAHDSDDGAVRTQEPPGAGDLIGVASVEGIVFGYDTGSFQAERPLSDRMSVWRCLKKCMTKSKKMVVLQGKKQ